MTWEIAADLFLALVFLALIWSMLVLSNAFHEFRDELLKAIEERHTQEEQENDA